MSETPITRQELNDALNRVEATVAAAVASLKELAEANDKRYEQRFTDSGTAVNAALAAAKEALKQQLEAAEKAAVIVRQALEEYKVGANEWRAASKDLINNMPTKNDVANLESKLDTAVTNLQEKIDDLRSSRSEGRGKDEALEKALELARDNKKWIVGLAWGLPTLILALAALYALVHAR